jgi:signal peptidase I
MRPKDYIIVAFAAIALALVLKTFVLEVVHVPSHSMETALLPGDYIVVNKLVHGSPPDPPSSLTASLFRIPPVRTLRTGDVVVFRLPLRLPDESEQPLFIKRCVAVPGDTIAVDRSVLTVNRHPLAVVNENAEYVVRARLAQTMILPGRGDILSLTPDTFLRWSDLMNAEGHALTLRNGAVFLDGIRTERYVVRQNYYFMLGDNADHSYDSRAWGLVPEKLVEGTAELVYWSVDHSDRPASHGFSSVRWDRIGHRVK